MNGNVPERRRPMAKEMDLIEVARLAGVSKSTVSRALNNEYGVSERTRKKVWKIVEDNKFIWNSSARNLRSGKSKTVGILYSDLQSGSAIQHPAHSQKIEGILAKCRELGYDAYFFSGDLSCREGLLPIIREKNLAGVLVLTLMDEKVVELLSEYQIPFVLLNWMLQGDAHQVYIKTDIAGAVAKGMESLWQRGYRNPAVFDWQERSARNGEVKRGFLQACRQLGLDPYGRYWMETNGWTETLFQSLLDNRSYDSYFCLSSHTSMQLLKLCLKKGIRVPDEIGVISFDYLPFYQYATPSLSGIRQDFERIGREGIEMLDLLIRGEPVDNRLLQADMVEMESY